MASRPPSDGFSIGPPAGVKKGSQARIAHGEGEYILLAALVLPAAAGILLMRPFVIRPIRRLARAANKLLFGAARMAAALNQAPNVPPEQLTINVLSAANAFIDGVT